jgi:hypothetical protein
MKEAFLMTYKKMKTHKNSFYLELVLLLILGFLIGAVIKTEAAKRITIGFGDYAAATLKQGYDFVQIEKNLNAGQNSGSEANPNEAGQSGESCSNQ